MVISTNIRQTPQGMLRIKKRLFVSEFSLIYSGSNFNGSYLQTEQHYSSFSSGQAVKTCNQAPFSVVSAFTASQVFAAEMIYATK